MLSGYPQVPATAGDKLVAKFIGNIPRSTGRMIAGTPDAAGAVMNTTATGVKTDVDGLVQLGYKAFGNTKAASQWNQTRVNDLNDVENQFNNLVLGMAGGPDGPTVQAMAGVMALGRNKPQIAAQFFNDALTKEGKNIFDDPAQAYLSFRGLGGAWRSADLIAARSTSKLVDRYAGTLNEVITQADKNGQLATAHAARVKLAQLRAAGGQLNKLIQVAQSRRVIAAAKEAVANPDRESFGQSAAPPDKPTRAVVDSPPPKVPPPTSPYSGAPAKAGASNMWDTTYKDQWDPYGYLSGPTQALGTSNKPSVGTWRDVVGIDENGNPKTQNVPQTQAPSERTNKVFVNRTTFTATRPAGTGQTYMAIQRNDMDWNAVRKGGPDRARGLTNKEAAKRFGYAPELPDGSFATLHHIGQDSRGPLSEASTRYHGVGKYGQDILHSQYGRNKPHPEFPINRNQFDVDTQEYWKWRAPD